ncbi:hypothetical protein DB346_05140 [Verrucomicrobia bacterium LW23]|nr:hypothetical protein DB346_05140 [Verrucomicrobia bacterium LW23]
MLLPFPTAAQAGAIAGLLMASSLLFAPISPAVAQDSALVDALVRKGILSSGEAENITSDLVREYQTTGGGKIELANHVRHLSIYGDARLRYQWDQQKAQAGGAVSPSNKTRVRLCLGGEYTFSDQWSAGVQLLTATVNDSANQNIGAGYGKFGINVGLLYLNWRPADWLSLTAGRQRNPFYTTDLVWDGDICLEGLVQVAAWKPGDSLSLTLTTGQLYFADNPENAAVGNVDVWQFVEQARLDWQVAPHVTVTLAPGVSTMTGGSTLGINTSAVRYLTASGADNLNLLLFPGEVRYDGGTLPLKFYWDFAYNTAGARRVQQTFAVAPSQRGLDDSIAWLIGVKAGRARKKGDWSVDVNFRTLGLSSVDSNLSDGDFAAGNLNQQGIKVSGQYRFTDSVTGGINLFSTWSYKDDPDVAALGNAGGIVSINSQQLVEFDLQWKF